MTPDQIRQIAEEYAEAEIVMSYANRDMNIFFVERFMKWLIERYCVLERSKVEEMYKHSHTECFMPTTCLDREFARNKCNVMESLFGSETFNKKKDENIE